MDEKFNKTLSCIIVCISYFPDSSAISLKLCNNVNAVLFGDIEARSAFHFLKKKSEALLLKGRDCGRSSMQDGQHLPDGALS